MINKTNNPMTRKTALLLFLALSGAALLTGCKKKEHIDPSSLHTSAAETMTAAPETMPESTAITIETEAETTAAQAKPAAPNITTKKNTYTSGKVSIEYPSILNLNDDKKTETINTMLKENAIAITAPYNVSDDQLDLKVTCQVLSAGRNRITVVYKGTVNGAEQVFYTNTIDVQKEKNLGLSDFADPYTMAGYVLSDDCLFPEADEALKAKLMKAKNELSLDDYTYRFTHADFSAEGTFPSAFSYEHEGNIYFSIPVPAELGGYAIVMYTPDTK